MGIQAARQTAEIVGDAVGCPATEVMVASTGVIGVQLNMPTFETGVPMAYAALAQDGGAQAARAIMTTDTRPKECAVAFSGEGIGYTGATFTVGGMAKGSGMIMPNMATMISAITTDAPIAPDMLHAALKRAVATSFNKVTVDSDTSTNDCCFLFASGAAPRARPAVRVRVGGVSSSSKPCCACATRCARHGGRWRRAPRGSDHRARGRCR